MKNLLFTGLLYLMVLQGLAQRNFQPGYIIQNNDTINGYVNLRTHKANSSSCQFKTQLKGDLQHFKASEISGYGTKAGNHYRSFKLKETSKAIPKGKEHPKDYFLNVLVAGKSNLFFGRDISGKSRFFIQKDTVFKELETMEVRIENKTDGKIYNGQSKTYIGTLTYLFSDCKDLKPLIDKTTFGFTSLLNTVRSYNQCLHPDSLYFVQKPKKSIATFGLTGGPIITTVKLSEPYNTTSLGSGLSRHLGYSVGLTMNNTLPFLNEKLSFQTELLLVRNYFNINYKFYHFMENAPPTNIVNYEIESEITRYAIKLPILLRYSFNFQKFRPFVNFGLMLTQDIKAQDKSLITGRTTTETKSSSYQGYYSRPLFGNFIAGAGLLYNLQNMKAVFVEVKFTPEGIPSLYYLTSDVSSVMINTGFRF